MTTNELERRDEAVLTVQEVAERLRVHPYTVYDLLRSGRLKGFKLNRRWRVVKSSLDHFMTANLPFERG